MNPSDPEEARRLLLEELSKGIYRRGESFVTWLLSQLERMYLDLLDAAPTDSPAGLAVGIFTLTLLGFLVLLILRRGGVLRRDASPRAATALDAEEDLTALELRERAEQALTDRSWDDAVVLALRAMVRDLDERTVLEVTEGMTAQEATTAAARAYRDLARPLQQLSRAFDTAAYSRRSATEKSAQDAVRLALYVAQTAPDPLALDTPSPRGAR